MVSRFHLDASLPTLALAPHLRTLHTCPFSAHTSLRTCAHAAHFTPVLTQHLRLLVCISIHTCAFLAALPFLFLSLSLVLFSAIHNPRPAWLQKKRRNLPTSNKEKEGHWLKEACTRKQGSLDARPAASVAEMMASRAAQLAPCVKGAAKNQQGQKNSFQTMMLRIISSAQKAISVDTGNAAHSFHCLDKPESSDEESSDWDSSDEDAFGDEAYEFGTCDYLRSAAGEQSQHAMIHGLHVKEKEEERTKGNAS
eukprot:98927-Pelagomonas_calceolata.AAC.1